MSRRAQPGAGPAPVAKSPKKRKPSAKAAARSPAMTEDDAAFRKLAKLFAADPRIEQPAPSKGKFGSNGLKVDGKIFAMCLRGALVVKLPASEVDEAVSEGRGERLTMGAGRVMKEWLVVHEGERRWPAIARRARAFVAGES